MDDAREASFFEMDDWISSDGHLLTAPEWAGQDIWDNYPLDLIS